MGNTNKTFAAVCIILITTILTIPLTCSEPTNSTYYSNTFDSALSLNDGYWQTNDTTVTDGKLQINGEASFSPQPGGYSLNNFTVQFNVYQNIMYANNTAYSGPFFQLCDSQNKSLFLLGYFQVENNGETHCEGCFENLMNYHHYYFLYNHTNEWSTWRLTGYIQQMTEDGLYWGNFTLQIDNETVTSFRSDSIIPEGTVYNITNEETKLIAYYNIYPLPQTGVMIIPTTSTNNGIHYSLLSNKLTTVAYSQAIPSYVDNFLFGYANAVPLAITSTSLPTPTPSPHQENTVNPTPGPTSTSSPTAIPEISWLAIVPLLIAVFSVAIIVKHRKTTNKSDIQL